jgi:hypothetical protein
MKFVRFHEIDGAIVRCHGDAGTLIFIYTFYFIFFPPPSSLSLFLHLSLFTYNLSYKILNTLKLQYPLCRLAYGVLWKAWRDVVLKDMFISLLLHRLLQLMT